MPWASAALTVFVAGRGRLNFDTKYMLHVDAAGLMSLSRHVWDPMQYGGYVAHQAIGYLWPAGPFHAAGQWLGIAPWVMQRLWLALILGIAASGVLAWLRSRGHRPMAATIAAILYQTSPFVLAYQARTSLMLIPWACLGWLALLTARAVRAPRWHHSAAAALVVGTAGAINATALLLVLPSLGLIALDEVRSRRATWRSSLVFAARSALLGTVLSLWWMATVVIQGRYGSRVLFFSETLEDVSLPATAFEVLRGFGYWLNYVGLDGTPVTSAAASSLGSPVAVAATLVFPVAALAGLLLASRNTRRLAVGLVATGLLLAVNVHPITDPPRLWATVAASPDSWLALAFRSSTRAIPVVLLGLCLGVAALLDSDAARRRRKVFTSSIAPSGLVACVCVVGVLAGVPARLTDGVADTTLSRSTNLPQSWSSLGRGLQARLDPAQRVLQLPGQEFAKYEWGYTGESALLAAQDRPILVRELLPLGDEQYMNLLGAVNDAALEGRLDPDKLRDLARLLGFGAVIVPEDLDDAFYATPDQQTVVSDNGLENARIVGGHRVFGTADAPGVLRVQRGETVVMGDGYGLVSAAGWNTLGGRTVRFAADLADADLADVVASAAAVVVTDSNRIRGQHWRSTRDAYGYSEDGTDQTEVLRRDPGDRRLRVFPTTRNADATLMEQRGPVRVRATRYGEALRYLPEHRPFASIDGLDSTSWSTGASEAGRPIVIVEASQSVSFVRVLQEQVSSRHRISAIKIGVDGGPGTEFALDESSLTAPGQLVRLPREGRTVRIQVARTAPGDERADRDTIGFAELDLGLGSSSEVGVLPTRGLPALPADRKLSFVLSRDRAPGWDSRRSDPERTMRREILVPGTRRFVLRAAVDSPAGVELPATLTVLLDERPVTLVQSDAESPGRYQSPEPVELVRGPHLIETLDSGPVVDEFLLMDERAVGGLPADVSDGQRALEVGRIRFVSPTERSGVLGSCDDGCWLVFGESFNPGWNLTVGGSDRGAPVRVDGGVNGWWLDGVPDGTEMSLRFRPQRTADIAQLLSLGGALLCLGIIARGRRRTASAGRDGGAPVPAIPRDSARRQAVLGVVFCGAAGFFVLPDRWTAVVIALAVVAATRRDTPEVLVRTGLVGVVAALVVGFLLIVRTPPPVGFLWSLTADRVHAAIMAFMVLALVGSVVGPSDRDVASPGDGGAA